MTWIQSNKNANHTVGNRVGMDNPNAIDFLALQESVLIQKTGHSFGSFQTGKNEISINSRAVYSDISIGRQPTLLLRDAILGARPKRGELGDLVS